MGPLRPPATQNSVIVEPLPEIVLALLPPVEFQGAFLHPRTGVAYPYAGTCVVVIDNQGRESMHVRGSIRRGNREAPLVVLGHVDPRRSFLGRESEAALDCIAKQCQSDAALQPFMATQAAELTH